MGNGAGDSHENQRHEKEGWLVGKLWSVGNGLVIEQVGADVKSPPFATWTGACGVSF